eukprot:TRINITY_DN49612_c0_g1_i2.p1 TRINITY_DN49612_c0_g1~~TRINITY_DN49612_c0_g1_i2.p1  ORF type:complete len:219 (+),score=18.64 TRINITY_DN49612_c0_g1_i2:115-771(+)
MALAAQLEFLLRRLSVLLMLVLFCLVPMWKFPIACDLYLAAFTLTGAGEWWWNVSRHCERGLKTTWAWIHFLAWFSLTVTMILLYRRPWAVGHQVLVECILIQLVVGDSAQMLCGRFLGKRKVTPWLSPKKSLEGYAGGLVVVSIYGSAVHGWPILRLFVAYVAGCLGDLYFSLGKRWLGVKDFSYLMGSHGGVLDRIDSYMFASLSLFWMSFVGVPT